MKQLDMFGLPLVFVDTETTGTRAGEHEIIEITILPLNGPPLVNTKIKPKRLDLAEQEALDINHYSDEAWKDAPQLEEVAEDIAKAMRNKIVVAHRPNFDVGFILADLRRAGIRTNGIGIHKIDTIHMATEHFKHAFGQKSVSLGNVCKTLGIEIGKAHSSYDDTVACREVYKILENPKWKDKMWWYLRGLAAYQ